MTRPALQIDPFQNLDPGTDRLLPFLATMRDGVAVVSADLRMTFFNDAYARMFGLGPGDVEIGDHLRDVMRCLASRGMMGPVIPDDIETFVAGRLAIWGTEETRVERRVTVAGRILDIYRAPTTGGNMVSIHVDVTESVRNAEEVERQRLFMKSLLEKTTDAITMLDKDGRFVMFNDRFLELYDIPKGAVSWGVSYDGLTREFGDLKGLPPEEVAAEVEARRRFAFDPSITHVRRRLKNGKTLNINKTLLPGGGCVMTIRDMTADLKREEELLKARNAAEDSNRHKSEFVARMSHEMRTPLNGILGVAALLQKTELSPRQTELVNVVTTSGKVLLRLIDDILDLSRIDAETFEVVEDRLDVVSLVEECVGLIRPAAEEKGLAVTVTLPNGPVPDLQGDTVRIKQILLNLLTNAVKFTERGSIATLLHVEEGPEGVTLSVMVADTGVGIAADKLEQIFNRFYQIDGTVTRKYGGAGLGLAITQKLVDAMGGAIQVTSRPGEGTTFRVRLTLLRADEAP